MPNTGGSNIPALNDFLSTWSIAFGDGVYDGPFFLQDRKMYFASGTNIIKFPKEGIVIGKKLKDQGKKFLHSLFTFQLHIFIIKSVLQI